MAKTKGPIPESMQEKVSAFAEQLARIAATVKNRTEDLVDRKALHDEMSKMRDAAAGLLDQLSDSLAPAKSKKPKASAAKSTNTKGRSGGFVDAPGKKHRKPMPSVKGRVDDSRIAKAKMQHESTRRRTPTTRG